jgi:hypothetical protein
MLTTGQAWLGIQRMKHLKPVKSRRVIIIVASCVCVALLVACYVAGYLFSGTVTSNIDIPPSFTGTADEFAGLKRSRFRMYDQSWKALLFSPAAKIESIVTGQTVHAAGPPPTPNKAVNPSGGSGGF